MAASFEQQTQELHLESTLDSVDLADQTALELARKVGFDEDDQNSISMAVRECMVNAVAHGNKYNARKKVYLKLDWLRVGKGPARRQIIQRSRRIS